MRLCDLLRLVGIRTPAAGARHVCFRGPKGEAASRCALLETCAAATCWGAAGVPAIHHQRAATALLLRPPPHPPHPPTPTLPPAPPSGELPKGEDGSYGTSITWAKAMDPASDVILAYKQNGRLLTPDHGFPLR